MQYEFGFVTAQNEADRLQAKDQNLFLLLRACVSIIYSRAIDYHPTKEYLSFFKDEILTAWQTAQTCTYCSSLVS